MKAESIKDLPYFEDTPSSARRGIVSTDYSLRRIAEELKVDHVALLKKYEGEGKKQVNDQVAGECVSVICSTIDPNWEVLVNEEVGGLGKLSSISSSPKERSDVSVILCNPRSSTHLVGFRAEVCSSPMIWTERKAILGAANHLRYQRMLGHTQIKSITTFAFPKLEVNHCLIEIEVSFEKLHFVPKLTKYADVKAGIKRLREVIERQCEHIFSLRQPEVTTFWPTLINMSNDECNEVCPRSTQVMSSGHIMVECDDFLYKVIYTLSELNSFRTFSKRWNPSVKLVIHPMETDLELVTLCYSYKKVQYPPLNTADAYKCLRELVEKIHSALEELHSIKLSHNDVRLPNVCFDDNFHPVLVDIDRCCGIDKLHPMFLGSNSEESCMYCITMPCIKRTFTSGKETDYFQLGWLVAWVLNKEGNYHERKWDTQSEVVKSNPFIEELITSGDYKSELLSHLPQSDSLKNVIQWRQRQH